MRSFPSALNGPRSFLGVLLVAALLWGAGCQESVDTPGPPGDGPHVAGMWTAMYGSHAVEATLAEGAADSLLGTIRVEVAGETRVLPIGNGFWDGADSLHFSGSDHVWSFGFAGRSVLEDSLAGRAMLLRVGAALPRPGPCGFRRSR